MQIETWIRDRATPGTFAHSVRRVMLKDRVFSKAEEAFRNMCVLEALMRHAGHQKSAAQSLGVTTHTVNRALRSMGLSCSEIRQVAKQLKAAQLEASAQNS